jgi:hypothetical protein
VRKLLLPAAIVAGVAGVSMALAATFTTVSEPDGTYLSTTAKSDFAGLDNFTQVTSVSDGTLEAAFSTEMSKRQAGVTGGGWAYWGALPAVESTTPAVLYTQGADTLSIVLSQPVAMFGFELEPNWFDTYNFTAEFRRSGATVGTVTRLITSNQVALLFAASSDAGIDEVVITSDVEFGDFAIAQLRYQLTGAGGQGPGTDPTQVDLVLPGSGAISVNAGSNAMITIVVATTSSFDALGIDPASAVFGPGEAHEPHGQGHAGDAGGDGDLDLVLHFRAQDTGIACGDTEASFRATTLDGEELVATAPVSLKGCGKK